MYSETELDISLNIFACDYLPQRRKVRKGFVLFFCFPLIINPGLFTGDTGKQQDSIFQEEKILKIISRQAVIWIFYACHIMAEWFPIAGLSAAMGKISYLCVLSAFAVKISFFSIKSLLRVVIDYKGSRSQLKNV